MGFLRKTFKKIGRGIKKIGKKIGKAFKSIIKPFAKVFNKLGPIGSIAMMMILPGIGQMMAGFGAGFAGSTNALVSLAGNAVKFVGNAINFVATAPQKILGSITNGITNAWNGLTGAQLPAGQNSWFDNFKSDMTKTWTSGGVTPLDAAGKPTGPAVGEGNFFDYSQQGQARIDNFKADFTKSKGQIKDIFTKDKRIKVTEDKIASTITDPKELELFNQGKSTKYVLDRTGAIGNVRDVLGGTVTKVKDVTVPGVGTVGDVAWGSNAALTAYNAYSSINPQEMEVLGGSGMGILAEEQLYGGDQGGMYNQTPPTWSYNQNMSVAQNQQNAVNAWNSNYGFPQGFDPYATPGYGFSYEQWLQQQMAA
jgi:hypothetical protein